MKTTKTAFFPESNMKRTIYKDSFTKDGKGMDKVLKLPNEYEYYDQHIKMLKDKFSSQDGGNVQLFFEHIEQEFFDDNLSFRELIYMMYGFGCILTNDFADAEIDLAHAQYQQILEENKRLEKIISKKDN